MAELLSQMYVGCDDGLLMPKESVQRLKRSSMEVLEFGKRRLANAIERDMN